MAGGRPTDYKPEFCEQVIEFGKQGMSKAEMCLELDICHQTMTNWSEEYPEFLAAVKKAIQYSQGWWEMRGRKATFSSEGFNATSYIFNMKNRFKEDWSDTSKQELTGKDGAPLGVKFEGMDEAGLNS
jgi:hypothetical protein